MSCSCQVCETQRPLSLCLVQALYTPPWPQYSEQRTLTFMLQAFHQMMSCRISAQTVWPAFCRTPQATSGRATPSGCSAAPSRPPHGAGGLPQTWLADVQAAWHARAGRGQLLQAKDRALPLAQ